MCRQFYRFSLLLTIINHLIHGSAVSLVQEMGAWSKITSASVPQGGWVSSLNLVDSHPGPQTPQGKGGSKKKGPPQKADASAAAYTSEGLIESTSPLNDITHLPI